jgi:retron-type reverse transcriptase
MKTYRNLYPRLCSIENLEEAFFKAHRRKSGSPAVLEFEKNWEANLGNLRKELLAKTYRPQPLKAFILRDPKTRKISVSAFRDRVVHHALVNVLQPIFEPRFIHDSYASRKGKGTLPALERFDLFMRRATRNGKLVAGARNGNAVRGFVLKADIYHYFETVDHGVLLGIIARRIKDSGVLWLVKVVLDNYSSGTPGRGMPLGNWTSQFFANVYLDELDRFVKHKLRVKYYIRYVDDFVILDESKERWKK